ncbi:MAG: DUF1800 domain-containing protein [Planctomyces sp.]|nr:DUF1800 domain-containing protein [Planctomyces sp.]
MSGQAIDPELAWRPWEPSTETPWDRRSAAHLFRRAGFGATSKELDEALEKHPQEVVESLLNATESDEYQEQSDRLAAAAVATGNLKQLPAWWSYRMLTTPAQLLEKTTLFWHGHFATSAAKVEDARLVLTQNRLLRSHAFGSFGKLVLEISRDPAMLIYLDSATNRKLHPNENYAREIMELFCLGEGRYTEQDIRELARCFTGWEIRREKFRFNSYQHDSGAKSFLGHEGRFGGEEAVAIVVSNEAVPEFIAGKLYRFFVADEPAPSKEIIAPLAKALRESELRIQPVLKTILGSQLFFSAQARGRKVRSPVELGIGLLRCLNGSANTFELTTDLEEVGQGLFFPPSVKGWDGGRTWINSSTLLGRSNMVRRLLTSEQTRFAEKSIVEYVEEHRIRDAGGALDFFETLLFAVPIRSSVRSDMQQLFEGSLSNRDKLINALHALCTLPEFQLA